MNEHRPGHTVYVEKRNEFADAARREAAEIRELLGIPELRSFRTVIRYDLFDVTDGELHDAARYVLSDPVTDEVTFEPPRTDGCPVCAIELLPGQFDQRADSAAEAIEILTGGTRPRIRTSTIYVLDERLSEAQVEKIQSHLLNPVDSRFCAPFGEALPPAKADTPPAIPRWNHLVAPSGEPPDGRELGLAMSADDLAMCRRYFGEEEGRAPTETEMRVLDTYWSDHCRHTTFETRLTNISIQGSGAAAERIRATHARFLALRSEVLSEERARKAPTLMELAMIVGREFRQAGKLEDLLVSEEVNAATISIDVTTSRGTEQWYLLFKNETHNHPTEIEPIGGAETCLGGAIRDPLSGRAYVHQAIRVTGSADPRRPLEETRKGKLPQRTITTQAARGFSSYGNQIGIATGVVHEYYHPGYEAKRMEVGAVVGAVPVENVVHERPVPGDVVLLIGGRTGRDGCGGATGSSKAHDISSVSEASAEVQKGNPPVERALQRLFRNGEFSRRVKRANDFGAGGVSVAVGEIAESLDIDLDAVPVKYDGLNGTELAISESQERMAVVVSGSDADDVIAAAADENLEATVIAVVTDSGRLRMRWRGDTIVDISREFLATNGAERRASVRVAPPASAGATSGGDGPGRNIADGVVTNGAATGENAPFDGTPTPAQWLARINTLEGAAQKGLSELFDSTIGAGTVLVPWGGRYGLTPSNVAAARIPHGEYDTTSVSIASFGFAPRMTASSPYHGAYWSVVESVARVVCAGGRRRDIRVSLQEYFPRPGDDPERWGLPYAALLGAMEAQEACETPAIGGKDSMSGSFEEMDVPPTVVSFAFCGGEESRIVGTALSPAGGTLVALVPERDESGLPAAGTVRTLLDTVETAIGNGIVAAAGTFSETGAIPALSAAALGNWCSLRLDAAALALLEDRFGMHQGTGVAVYIQLHPDAGDAATALTESPCAVVLGRVEPDGTAPLPSDRRGPLYDPTGRSISWGSHSVALSDIRDAWFDPLGEVFPLSARSRIHNHVADPHSTVDRAGSNAPEGSSAKEAPSTATNYSRKRNTIVYTAQGHPRVCIPVFPGTNCEYDSARAFRDAGAIPVTPVFRTHSPDELSRSIEELARHIRESRILMFPGGFSAGDEPDGSGKYIAAIFRDERLRDAVTELMERRDGLILGICNGFQALVRMGLLPGGIEAMGRAPEAGLFLNDTLRHISTFVPTRVVSTRSPWLAATDPDAIYTVPISHGEGRFIATDEMIAALSAGGQIATQYVEYNPNGSAAAIEGITSPDGRILGKMAHNERVRPGLYKNLPPMADMKIFENGVAYFR